MFIGHITFKTLKHTQVLRLKLQHNKIHQITNFHNFQKQQHLNMNSSTIQQPQLHSSSISYKNISCSYLPILTYKFNKNNNTINIQFMYIIMSTKLSMKFYNQNQIKHLTTIMQRIRVEFKLKDYD